MSTPAGWYDDGSGAQRWWDGNGWTPHVQDAATAVIADPGVAPAGPQRPGSGSKLWILFVVLGVVVVVMIALAAFFIPRLIATAVQGVGSPTSQSPLPGEGGGAVDPQAEQAAIDAVLLYDEAWNSGDCAKFFAATTEAFREGSDCSAFESDAAAFTESTDDYVVTIVRTSASGDAVIVETSEDFLSLYDDEGTPLETPEPASERWSYTVVDTGDSWAIDAAE